MLPPFLYNSKMAHKSFVLLQKVVHNHKTEEHTVGLTPADLTKGGVSLVLFYTWKQHLYCTLPLVTLVTASQKIEQTSTLHTNHTQIR